MRDDAKDFLVATWNVWHGLAEKQILRFREFEEPERRSQRWTLATQELQRLLASSDSSANGSGAKAKGAARKPRSASGVFFLQELNPVESLGAALQATFPGSQFFGRIDQGGIKLFGVGLPLNLATGLGTLLVGESKSQDLSQHDLRLSGSWGFSGAQFSFHTTELRYAQFTKVMTPALGRVLFVNTHLHHGFERFAKLMRVLDEAVASGSISADESQRLLPFLDGARDRRLAEVDRLIGAIEHLTGDCDGVIVGGDFNASPESGAYKQMLLSGYHDLQARFAKAEKSADTWDPVSNQANHRLQGSFAFPLPTFGNSEFQSVYRKFDSFPRRIDFLFAKGSPVERPPKTVEIFGRPKGGAMAPSDHYGVVARWTNDSSH